MTTSPVFFAPADDPKLARAMERARDTFKYFWRELTWEYRRIVPGLDVAAIKVAFNDPGGAVDDVEHMWLSQVHFDGALISATLLNDPNWLRSVKRGDRVSLKLEELEDWMYAVGGKVCGGFTVDVLRAGMSDAERRSHDSAWGLDFGSPTEERLVPEWRPPAKTDPDAEHPMSENMAGKLADAVAQNPQGFFQPDEDGLTMLHSLALGGSEAGVRVLLHAGADPQAKTKAGFTAKQLAQRMGWSRVVALFG